MDQSVLPECYVDTCLIETLVPPEAHYNHQKGSGTVAKKMKDKFSDRFALGIIDKDKRELHYLQEFTEIAVRHNLELYKHPQRHHYFILINPAVETFVLRQADFAQLSLADFGLPPTLNELRKVSKTITSKFDSRFIQLFNALKEANIEEINLLISWITYLKRHHYLADPELLRRM